MDSQAVGENACVGYIESGQNLQEFSEQGFDENQVVFDVLNLWSGH